MAAGPSSVRQRVSAGGGSSRSSSGGGGAGAFNEFGRPRHLASNGGGRMTASDRRIKLRSPRRGLTGRAAAAADHLRACLPEDSTHRPPPLPPLPPICRLGMTSGVERETPEAQKGTGYRPSGAAGDSGPRPGPEVAQARSAFLLGLPCTPREAWAVVA